MHARWKTALLAALPAAMLAFAAGPASADTDVSSSSRPELTAAARQAGQAVVGEGRTPSTTQSLSAYWTPERMKAARPADQALSVKAAAARKADRRQPPKPTGPAGKVKPAKPLAAPARPKGAKARQAATWPGYPYYSFQARTAGKVFFTKNGLNYVCSGTIVNSEGKNSVWTAGHCVHGGNGGNWHANWVFVPSYSAGWAPYGVWSARQLWSKTSWTNSSDFTSDMGVAIMNTQWGYRIVDYLGGQGITWNQSKRIGTTSFGYPAASPFNGLYLWICPGTTFPEWEILWWSAETLGLNCDMTGGSSGGGWLAYYNGTTGYVNGNNSYKYDNDPNTMYSPYYDDTASSLYGTTRFL
jgi:V8-like Glu-specific endopeptidase